MQIIYFANLDVINYTLPFTAGVSLFFRNYVIDILEIFSTTAGVPFYTQNQNLLLLSFCQQTEVKTLHLGV